MRLFIELSYLGKNYHGWQIQPNAASVQEMLEEALSQILRTEIRIHGSSRTDTGVHARQQFAHFDLDHLSFTLNDLIWKLNSFLPADIAIRNIHQARPDAHSRFDALSRKYIYRLSLKKNPFRQDDVLYLKQAPDFDKMNEAAGLLMSYTDFECFSKVKTDVETFNCSITEARWFKNNELFEFHIRANRFLRGMVRAVVGTLLEVGLEKITVTDFDQIIQSKKRSNAGKTVEAHGLTLEEVSYPQNYFDL